jgi:hypothetical protein
MLQFFLPLVNSLNKQDTTNVVSYTHEANTATNILHITVRFNFTFVVLLMGTRGSFPGVKRPGREADHSPSSSAEVKE